MDDDWRDAFLAQARAEYGLFQTVRTDDGVPLCLKLHLLQMVTEKLAKAFLTPSGTRPVRTHNAFARFMQTSATNSLVRGLSRYRPRTQFRAFVGSLLPLAQRIEDLSPEGDDHPNPEYPWQQNGQVISPLTYHWREFTLQSPPMLKMLQFLEDCLRLS